MPKPVSLVDARFGFGVRERAYAASIRASVNTPFHATDGSWVELG